MEKQSISNAPMILGIIGGVLGLPAAICSGACAAGLTALADTSTVDDVSAAGGVFMWFGIIASLLGLLASFLYRKNPKLWGAFWLVCGILSGITLITFNFLSLIVCILFLIAGIIALTQHKPSAL